MADANNDTDFGFLHIGKAAIAANHIYIASSLLKEDNIQLSNLLLTLSERILACLPQEDVQNINDARTHILSKMKTGNSTCL